MGLKEVKKELEDQIEKATELEKAEEGKALDALSAAVEEAKNPESEDKKEDAKVEEPSKEDVKEEPKAEETAKEEKTPTDYAKDRQAKKREKAVLSEELAAANARIAALEAASRPVLKQEVVNDPEPDKTTNPLGWADWRVRQVEKRVESLAGWKAEQDTVKNRESIKEKAQREVQSYENQLRISAPDYDAVKDWYGSMLATSIKIVNPKLSHSQIVEAVNNRLLTRAAELQNEGYENPVEAMYLEAKALGYQAPKGKEVENKEDPKPDLDKVAQFRKRNAGTAGNAGSGGESDVTARVAATMTNAEFAKLKPEQKKKLFASLRG